MLLSHGQTVYYGSASQSIDYFANLGYECDPFTNPADFLCMTCQMIVQPVTTVVGHWLCFVVLISFFFAVDLLDEKKTADSLRGSNHVGKNAGYQSLDQEQHENGSSGSSSPRELSLVAAYQQSSIFAETGMQRSASTNSEPLSLKFLRKICQFYI